MMKKILVVDDEPSLREIYVQFLSSVGYEVDATASGEEALEAVTQQSYDLLVLDLCLVGMDGLTTFKQVKRFVPGAKAVVVSGSLDRFEAEIEETRSDGLMGVLLKPFKLQELSTLVDTAFAETVRAA